jgi:hypothetical protein
MANILWFPGPGSLDAAESQIIRPGHAAPREPLRKANPESLVSEIRGDLDWIVMKALVKERSRRYDSASRFAEDVERYLNNEMVEARAPSTWYQLQKFYVRNRVLALSVAAIIISLSLGLAAALWGIVEANDARRREENAKDAAEVAATVAREKEQIACRLLAKGNDLVIQRSLLLAFAGRVEEMRQIAADYGELFGDDNEEWMSILEAAAHLHHGDYARTQEILKPIVARSSDQVPATDADRGSP